MSRLNRKLPRRVAVALGSACFLGGLTLAASSANAGLYVALKPVVTGISGATVTGNVFTGYTLTLPPGSYTSGISVQLVSAITAGSSTTTAAANPALLTLRGAVNASKTGTGSGVINSGFVYNSTVAGATVRSDLLAAALPGTPTGTASVKGLGLQSGNFGSSNSTNSPNDLLRFEVQTSTTTNDSAGVPSPAPVTNSEATIATLGSSASVSGATGDTVTFKVVGGDQANGTTSDTAWGQYFENFNAANRPGSIQYSYNGSSVSSPLTINFAAATNNLGDLNGDKVVNALDLQLLLSNFNASPATFSQGDQNGDNVVNALDLQLLLSVFNSSYPGSAPLLAPSLGAAIPEPSSLAFAGVAGLALVRRRRA
jgi:hypothetical protein